jgi:hypothetical protein
MPLGEPDGTCSNYRPGATNIMLHAFPNRWSAIAEEMQDVVAIPMVELLPSAVRQWAALLMGRGRSAPAVILPLETTEAWFYPEKQPDLTAVDLKRRVATRAGCGSFLPSASRAVLDEARPGAGC